VGSITTSPFGTMSFIRNSANSKLGNSLEIAASSLRLLIIFIFFVDRK
jgi:hypothetical protein